MWLRSTFTGTFRLEVIIASVVFGLVMLLLLAALIRSATHWGKTASHKHEHNRMEGSYAVALACMAAFLAVVSITANTFKPSPKPALTINVTGFQWCWRFAYAGTSVVETANCVDGHTPTLTVPTGEPVRFNVTSADVVHGMWIPYLRFKLWAYPSHTNSFTTTVDHTGSWPGRCSEFCGLYHYAMDFTLRSMPPQQFTSWLHRQDGGHS